MRLIDTAVTTVFVVLAAGVSAAAAFEVNVGKWEITTTTKMAMMPEPQTKTSTECIKEKTAEEVLGTLTEKNICTIKEHSEKGDTLEWKMECRDKGTPPTTGSGKITSQGDTLTGEMDVSMKMGEQEMKFETTWKGKRIGECP
jgi:Protein of unknown function (DUF3617)